MAEKRKRVGFRSKRPSAGQPSVIRFNVAEETTETVSQSEKATPPGSAPVVAAKQPVKEDGDGEASSVAVKKESEVVVGGKNTRSGHRDAISLFDDSVGDLDLFGEQTGTSEEREVTQEQRAISSNESSPPEGSPEPSSCLWAESDHVTTGPSATSANGDTRIERSWDIEVTEQLSPSELDIGKDSASVCLDKEDDEVMQDQVATHQIESDSVSMSSDHELHVGFFDSHKDEGKFFVSEHPLTVSVEPSSEESEDDSEPLKQLENSFKIIDDYFQQSPVEKAALPKTKSPKGKIRPARPPPPKQSHLKEARDISKTNIGKAVKSDKIEAAVVERKIPAKFVYWSFEFQSLLIFSTVIFIVNTVNTSVYLSGVLDGVMWLFLTMCAFLYLNLRNEENSHRNHLASLRAKPLVVSSRTRVALQPRRCLEGDFAAIRFYASPLHHQPSLTTKVHVVMDGHNIHISASEEKQMSFYRLADEQDGDGDNDGGGECVTSTKVLDLRGATVQLAPYDLSRKQRFSKKFPMKVTFKYSVPDISVSLSMRHSMSVHHKRGRIHDDDDRVLYLFAPTSHEKELWFWRLQLACSAADGDSPYLTTPPHFDHYAKYICQLVPDTEPQPNRTKAETPKQKFSKSKRQRSKNRELQDGKRASGNSESRNELHSALTSSKQLEPQSYGWFNAFMGRLFWDAWNESYLRDRLHLKWQHKLDKTKRPSFMRPLTITALSLGNHLPVVTYVHGPYVNDQGIWVDLDLDYTNGTFCITLETSLNFIPIGEKDTTVADNNVAVGANSSCSHSSRSSVKIKLRKQDSDIDSGAEEDDERTNIDEPSSLIITPSEPKTKPDQKQTDDTILQQSSSKSALLRIADKVLQSRIVRKAAQTRLGQRVTQKVNDIPLVLTVEVTSLKGCLSVGMSPPPTDRIWYGFRTMPEIQMIPTPKVGSKMVNYHMITEWIDRKLRKQIEKQLVFPHMEDLVIPILESGIKPAHIVPQESTS